MPEGEEMACRPMRPKHLIPNGCSPTMHLLHPRGYGPSARDSAAAKGLDKHTVRTTLRGFSRCNWYTHASDVCITGIASENEIHGNPHEGRQSIAQEGLRSHQSLIFSCDLTFLPTSI